jgi:hypothetical protein
MFPNVRLMIAALFASVIALSCGFGLFAALRATHEPLAHLPPVAGQPPALSNSADPSAFSPANAVTFEHRFSIDSHPVVQVAANLPAPQLSRRDLVESAGAPIMLEPNLPPDAEMASAPVASVTVGPPAAAGPAEPPAIMAMADPPAAVAPQVPTAAEDSNAAEMTTATLAPEPTASAPPPDATAAPQAASSEVPVSEAQAPDPPAPNTPMILAPDPPAPSTQVAQAADLPLPEASAVQAAETATADLPQPWQMAMTNDTAERIAEPAAVLAAPVDDPSLELGTDPPALTGKIPLPKARAEPPKPKQVAPRPTPKKHAVKEPKPRVAARPHRVRRVRTTAPTESTFSQFQTPALQTQQSGGVLSGFVSPTLQSRSTGSLPMGGPFVGTPGWTR